ncbi:MarR family transcriptional regulator [uncultured Serinicoccus sp.]|uniref:MarR family winged helix-turn-helix transcriptional regulator n=1 Tax=uncultured Serinicoccus sp. TaxID=735514 RepID=UPI00262B0BC0|nr:MarR family transcriptional regulator [uncultured Serinicoccus sp.]
MTTTWLTDPERAAWVRLAAVLERLPGVLDTQLRRDSGLTHFEYYTLAMLSEAEGSTLRMTALAAQTNATLPRLSHVVRRLEGRGLVARMPCPEDARATNASLTDAGWGVVQAAAPGHAAAVRGAVIDALTTTQIDQLTAITSAILERIDPDRTMAAIYSRYDEPAEDDPGASTRDDPDAPVGQR